MKTQRLSVCLFVLSLFANPMLPRSAAQAKNDPFASPGPAQTTVNPYDWFRVGESLRALGTTTYNYAVADAMKEKYKELRDLFVKVRVSEPTLTAFNAHASAMFDLPWQKNWDQWTEAERAKWTTDPTWQPLDAALSKDRFAMPAAAYFYTMGYQALNIGWFQAWRMDNGAKLADCVPALKGAINDYSWLIAGSSTSPGNPDLFKQLTAEMQAAVKEVTSRKSKISEDPLNPGPGLDKADFDATVQAMRTIRQAAKENKLVQ